MPSVSAAGKKHYPVRSGGVSVLGGEATDQSYAL